MMTIRRFTLSAGDESEPRRSLLLLDGKPTSVRVPGRELLRQYTVVVGYLLVTDYDSPYEESVNFVLLNQGLRMCSRRRLSPKFAFVPTGETYLLQDIIWEDERNFIALFYGDAGKWRFTIRRFSIPFVYPMLGMVRLS